MDTKKLNFLLQRRMELECWNLSQTCDNICMNYFHALHWAEQAVGSALPEKCIGVKNQTVLFFFKVFL